MSGTASSRLLRTFSIMYPPCTRNFRFQNTHLAHTLRSSQVTGIKPSISNGFRYTFSSAAAPNNTASPSLKWPSVLQLVGSAVRSATHRSRISRIPLGSSRPSPRDPFLPGGGPEGAWDRFRRILNSTPPNYIVWGILGLNGVVFAMWTLGSSQYRNRRDPTTLKWLNDNFTSSMRNFREGRYWTLLTCCFSHESISHFLVNAFSFYFMAPAVISLIGNARFLTLYFGGGIFSSLAGLAWRNTVQHADNGSHGASGAIYGILSFYACVLPKSEIYLLAIIPVPAWAFVTGIFLWDGYSAIYEKRSQVDTSGHVGGILAGIGYFLKLRFGL